MENIHGVSSTFLYRDRWIDFSVDEDGIIRFSDSDDHGVRLQQSEFIYETGALACPAFFRFYKREEEFRLDFAPTGEAKATIQGVFCGLYTRTIKHADVRETLNNLARKIFESEIAHFIYDS